MIKVTTLDGKIKNYKITLKMMSELGYANRIPARWHYVEYKDMGHFQSVVKKINGLEEM